MTPEVKAKRHFINRHGPIGFLGGIPTVKDPLTIHHIKAKRNGGTLKIYNLAPLTRSNHDRFNRLEKKLPWVAAHLNEVFLTIDELTDLKTFIEIVQSNKEIIDEYYPQVAYTGNENKGKKKTYKNRSRRR